MTQDEEPSSTGGCIARAQEIEAAIKGLTPANSQRLRNVCQYWLFVLGYYGGYRDTVEDLLQSAVVKVLDGTRRWNKAKVDFVGLLAGIIQSDASHALERYARGGANMEPVTESELVRLSEEGEDCDPLDRIAFDPESPETELIDRESKQEKADLVGRVLTLFENDEQASDVLLHRLDGLTGPEIQKLMGLSKKEYATVDQRIRRGFGRLSEAGGKHEH
jgi:DNA-directed RNA polymerase specialized sigma24 family protein